MKRRFTNEQIIGILKQHKAGASAAEVCRQHGMSDATFYKRRSKLDSMEASEAKRLRDLEDETRKLKRLVADLSLDKLALKGVLKKI